jgi:hypothetical protein
MTVRHRQWSTITELTAVLLACLLSLSPVTAQSVQRGAQPASFDTKMAKADPAIKELATIARDLMRRALGPDADRAALIAAYKSGDESRVRTLLGLSTAEEAALSGRMKELSALLLDRYPQLREIQEKVKADCPECRMTTAVRLLEMPRPIPRLKVTNAQAATCAIPAIFTEPFDSPEADETSSEPILLAGDEEAEEFDDGGCSYLPYTAALVLCTALGPLLYWACAVLAYCEFCEGSTHDTLCGPYFEG